VALGAHTVPVLSSIGPVRESLFPRLCGYGAPGGVALTFDDGPDPFGDTHRAGNAPHAEMDGDVLPARLPGGPLSRRGSCRRRRRGTRSRCMATSTVTTSPAALTTSAGMCFCALPDEVPVDQGHRQGWCSSRNSGMAATATAETYC